MSWYRCREEYRVDPGLDRAPAAAEVRPHSIDHDVMFAELGGLATSAAAEVDGLDGLVTVANSEGRVLASWGSRRILHLAAAVLNVACWKTSLSDAVVPWLRTVAAATEAKLRQRAHHSGTLLAAPCSAPVSPARSPAG